MPKVLHWFKWQNFTTWASGIALLIVVYYMGGASLLGDPGIAKIHPHALKTIGIGGILVAWIVYDVIWKTVGKASAQAATALSIAGLFGLAYGLTHVMSGRAAFLHVGVIMGTCMTGNVWMTIVPSQRELVRATEEGREQDKALSLKAKQRSIHNNYLTFPLLFIMVSNHFPAVTGAKWSWAALFVVMATGATVRHFMNVRFVFKPWFPVTVGVVLAGLLGTYVLTARWDDAPSANTTPVRFAHLVPRAEPHRRRVEGGARGHHARHARAHAAARAAHPRAGGDLEDHAPRQQDGDDAGRARDPRSLGRPRRQARLIGARQHDTDGLTRRPRVGTG
jgi:uncharacterized membrane protein